MSSDTEEGNIAPISHVEMFPIYHEIEKSGVFPDFDRIMAANTHLTNGGQIQFGKNIRSSLLNEGGYRDSVNVFTSMYYNSNRLTAYLRELLYRDTPILNLAITKQVMEQFRAGMTISSRFVKQCTECGEEYQTNVTHCTTDMGGSICGGRLRAPNYAHKKQLRKFMNNVVNAFNQTIRMVNKQISLDVEKHDYGVGICMFNYQVDPETKRLVYDTQRKDYVKKFYGYYRGDPSRVRPTLTLLPVQVNDMGGNATGSDNASYNLFFVCPVHRRNITRVSNTELVKHVVCEECGIEKEYAEYVLLQHESSQTPIEGYLRGEVIAVKKYDPARVLGMSKIDTLLYPILFINGNEKIMAEYAMDRRIPRGFMVIQYRGGAGSYDKYSHMINEEMDKFRNDPSYIPMFPLELNAEVKFVRMDDSPFEVAWDKLREEFRRVISSMYGISNIFTNDTSVGGGLNNEGLQLAATNRSIEDSHQVLLESLLKPLSAAICGVPIHELEYYYEMNPHEEMDKMAELQRTNQKLLNMQLAQMIGAEVVLDSNGEFVLSNPLPDQPLVPAPFQGKTGSDQTGLTEPQSVGDFDGATQRPPPGNELAKSTIQQWVHEALAKGFEDWSYEKQVEYIENHPNTNKKPTKQPGNKPTAEDEEGDASGATEKDTDGTVSARDIPPEERTYSDIIQMPEFKQWFGDWTQQMGSKIVDDEGKPLVVYHGSTHDFEEFDYERTNIENDMGKGFYFTTDLDDARKNYGAEGPDLQNRISQEIDRLMNEEDLSEEEATERAEAALKGDTEQVYEVFLNIRNPAVLDPQGGSLISFIDKEQTPQRDEYDSDEEYEEAYWDYLNNDALHDNQMLDILWDVANNYPEIDTDRFVDDVTMKIIETDDYEYLSVYEFNSVVREVYEKHYQDAETYNAGQIVQEVLRNLGHDGIVYSDATNYFGNKVSDMQPKTAHIVAFDPTQVKSVRAEEFSPMSANMFKYLKKANFFSRFRSSLSSNWDNMTYTEQRNYLMRHPKSKKVITKSPSQQEKQIMENPQKIKMEVKDSIIFKIGDEDVYEYSMLSDKQLILEMKQKMKRGRSPFVYFRRMRHLKRVLQKIRQRVILSDEEDEKKTFMVKHIDKQLKAIDKFMQKFEKNRDKIERTMMFMYDDNWDSIENSLQDKYREIGLLEDDGKTISAQKIYELVRHRAKKEEFDQFFATLNEQEALLFYHHAWKYARGGEGQTKINSRVRNRDIAYRYRMFAEDWREKLPDTMYHGMKPLILEFNRRDKTKKRGTWEDTIKYLAQSGINTVAGKRSQHHVYLTSRKEVAQKYAEPKEGEDRVYISLDKDKIPGEIYVDPDPFALKVGKKQNAYYYAQTNFQYITPQIPAEAIKSISLSDSVIKQLPLKPGSEHLIQEYYNPQDKVYTLPFKDIGILMDITKDTENIRFMREREQKEGSAVTKLKKAVLRIFRGGERE